MLFDDLEGPLCTPFQNTCNFGAKHKYLNEDRPTLSAAKMSICSVQYMQYSITG